MDYNTHYVYLSIYPPHFSPSLHPMGGFPPPAAPCKPQNPGRRPPAARRRANGLRPFRRCCRTAGPAARTPHHPCPPSGPSLPSGISPRPSSKSRQKPPIRAAGRPPPSGGQTGSARFGGSAAGPAARTPRKLFPYTPPPTKSPGENLSPRAIRRRYSVISPAPARSGGSPPRSSRRAPGRCASRFRGNCW